MSEVIVPRNEIKDLVVWGFSHGKYEPTDRTREMDQPVTWAKERVMINQAGKLIFTINSPIVNDVKYFRGYVSLERHTDYDPYGVMGLVVVHQEIIKPTVIDFKVNETSDRSEFVLEQLQRTDTENLFEPVEPDLEFFLGHLATIKSVSDFDWSEAESIAASFSNNPDLSA